MLPQDQVSRAVRAHLRRLREEWTQRITDDDLLIASNSLRLLIAQGELQRAWKGAGFEKQPIIATPTLDPLLENLDLDKVILVVAGGANLQGREIRNFVATRGMLEPQDQNPAEAALALTDFANSYHRGARSPICPPMLRHLPAPYTNTTDLARAFQAQRTWPTVRVERTGIAVCVVRVKGRLHGLSVVAVAWEQAAGTDSVESAPRLETLTTRLAIGVERAGDDKCRRHESTDSEPGQHEH